MLKSTRIPIPAVAQHGPYSETSILRAGTYGKITKQGSKENVT